MINKLLYRSRQRGFLELDLMVGLWAEREVPQMSRAMMDQFSVVLDLVRVCAGLGTGTWGEVVMRRLEPASSAFHWLACACIKARTAGANF